jgi:acyl-CoA synthetase (AMP-forming)/AMP-acid ligase II
VLETVNAIRAQRQWGETRARTLNPDRQAAYVRQHRAIARAIDRRDPPAAAAAMRDHLMAVNRAMVGEAADLIPFHPRTMTETMTWPWSCTPRAPPRARRSCRSPAAQRRGLGPQHRGTLALTPEDRCLNVMPLFHIHGLIAAVLSSLAAGRFDLLRARLRRAAFFGWLEEAEPTWYTAVPTMHQAILSRAARNAEIIAARAACASSAPPRPRCPPR